MADDGSEIIGGVGVTVTGDYSDLADSFTSAQADAQAAGESIAEAFNSGAAGADAMAGASEEAAGAVQHVGQESQEAGINVGDLGKKLLEVAGIGLSIGALKEFASSALETFAATEKAEIALTAMTGSAEGAAASIAQLKEMALDLALPFEGLLQADQKLTAFGVSAAQIPGILHAAADAAAAAGNSFDAVVSSMERMGISGMVSARMLVQLGLQTKDIADAMGVSVGEMSADFKALDEETKFQVIREALQKFQGDAEKVVASTGGAWQRFKTEFGLAMEDVGGFLAPVGRAIAAFGEKVAEEIRLVILSFETLGRVAAATGNMFKDMTTGNISAMAADFTAATAAANSFNTAAAKITGQIKEQVPATAALTAEQVKAKVAAQLHAQGLGEAAEAVDKFKRSMPPMSNELQVLAEREKEAQATHQAFVREVAESGLTWAQYGNQLARNVLIQDAMTQAFLRSAAAEAPIPGESLKAAQQIDFLDKQIGTMNTSLAASESAWLDLSNGMATAGLDLTHIKTALSDAEKSTKSWTHETGLVDRAFTTLGQHITQSIFQAKTFGDVWKGVLKSVGEEGVSELINWLMKLAAKQVEQLLVTKAATSTEDVAQVAGAAAVGGANVAAWTASIPFVGPGLAPAAGMAEYAAIMGQFGPLASFAKGIDYVPYDMVAQIHQGEKITPASENTGSGSGHTFNFYGTISGVTKETITQVATQMVRQLRLGNARI